MSGFGLIALVLAIPSSFSRAEDAPERPYIPPTTHFTIATPGTQWLNVSRPLTVEDLRDKIVLLDFWTYCCVNCMQTIPELAKLEKEFKQDLVVIGVHSAKFDTEKDTDQIRQAILRYGVGHPVVNDRDFRIWRAFDVRSWPTLVLLKPDGEVAKTFIGEGHTAELRKAIKETMKAFPKRAKANLPIELERDKVAKGEFFYPSKIAFDEKAKTLYVADSSHHQIAAYTWNASEPTKLKPAFRIGKSGDAGFKNGSYSSARFRLPQGIAVGKGVLYVADTGNHAVRKIDLKSRTVSTVAGTGTQGSLPKNGKGMPALSTPLASPWDVAFHPDDDHLVIAMAGLHELWSLDLKSKRMNVIAGNGVEAIDDGVQGDKNTLAQPSGLSSLLGSLYFVDAESSSLRFYFEGYVRTLVGSGLFDFGFKDGERKKAKLQHPLALFADVTGIFVADTYNHAIRRYDPPKQTLETVIGDGKPGASGDEGPVEAAKARLNEPSGIERLADGMFAISDTNNHRLVLWNRTTNQVERMRVDGEKAVETGTPGSAAGASATVAASKRISVRLPNRIETPEAVVNRTNPTIRVVLPEGYHLNEEGPSYARLFEGEPPKEKLKQEWKREDLVKTTVLSPEGLKTGMAYTLQGTFYFCMDGKNAVCEIASVSFPVKVDPAGAEKIDVALKKP